MDCRNADRNARSLGLRLHNGPFGRIQPMSIVLWDHVPSMATPMSNQLEGRLLV